MMRDWTIHAIRRIRPAQWGQVRTSIANTLNSMVAQGIHRLLTLLPVVVCS